MNLETAPRETLVYMVRELEAALTANVPDGLTPIEGRLYGALANADGRILTRDQLISAGWYDREPVTDDGIRHHVKRLRRKGYNIQAHYGIGYSMKKTPAFLKRAGRSQAAHAKLKGKTDGNRPRRADTGRRDRGTADHAGNRTGSGRERPDGAT